MARKTTKDNGEALALIGVLLFIPFLAVSIISFNKLKQAYLADKTAQRVMDIRRLGPVLITSGGLCAAGAGVFAYSIGVISNKGFIMGPAILAVLAAVPTLFLGYYTARYLAVLYLGIAANKQADLLVFPHDMQSYTITDYFNFQFLHDLCHVDSIPLSAITKLTRGRGKELYIHGPFGSRGISMSSKQKRDECLAMIQALSGKKGLMISEIESY